MLTHAAALIIRDQAGLIGQVIAEKVGEVSFADKADSGGILAIVIRQADRFGDGAHLRFLQCGQRELDLL